MKTKIGVVAIVALMLLFAVVAVFSAVGFLQAPQPIAKLLGVAVLGIVAVGLWTLWRELRFGLAMERLGRTLEAEGGLPADDLPRSAAGRIDRAAADAQFETFRAEADAAPHDWRSWYRLSLGYDASGDRSRARRAMRDAIRLHRG
jgi:ABC-type nickel/cobalt efflux system permease component RcnA